MFNLLLYLAAILCLILSFAKNKEKTLRALKKSLKSFENILPQFLWILLLAGMGLAWFDRETITRVIGSESGNLGLVFSAFVGSITLVPAFVAYPVAGELLRAGAGYAQITMFITSLMMVGLVTLPLEKQIFGKAAYWRNGLGLLFSWIASWIMGAIFQ